jgi:hypothetical protein
MIWFGSALWPSLILCTILYVLDYYLTIAGARLYRAGARQIIIFEGSYELTPTFQADIDRLRWFSKRFAWALIRLLSIMSLTWWLTRLTEIPQLFTVYLGLFVGLQLAIQRRHLQNIFLFRAMMKPGAVSGQISYSRLLILKQSSFEMMVFGALFAALSLLTWNLFLLGGAFGCLLVAAKHAALAQKSQRSAAPAEDKTYPDLQPKELV